MRITAKLAILVGITLIGLCAAGLFAGSMMQKEMVHARIEQTRAIVETARSMALAMQKQVEAGKLTKEAAIEEWGSRVRTMTYDNGNGYMFSYTMDGVTVSAPDAKTIGTNRLNVETSGRALVRELRDGIIAGKGEVTLYYEYMKPGEKDPIRKMSYAVSVPGWNLLVGTGAYLDDLDAKLMPIAVALGIAILAIAAFSGAIAWLIGRSITRPLGQLGARMQTLADGQLDEDIPGRDRRDEVGAMAATVQVFKDNALRIRGLEQQEAEAEKRAAAERQAAMQNIANEFESSVDGIVRSVASSAVGMQRTAESMTASASDASGRAANVASASERASNNVGTVAAAAEELSSSVAEIARQVSQSNEIASRAVGDAERTNATVQVLSSGAEKIGEVVQLIHSIAAQTNRSGARRRGGTRLRRGGLRGQGAGQPDRQGHRGNLGPGRGDAVDHQRRGGVDPGHHRDHRAHERDHHEYLQRDRGAGCGDARDRAQHPVGGGRIERDQRSHRRRQFGGGCDRHGRGGRLVQRARPRPAVRHAALGGG
jgi:methyl-accepting chemotaxis protein